MAKALEVLVSGHRVGQIESPSENVVQFLPDPKWLEANQRPPLGLAFLTDPKPRMQRDGRLPAWFENLLPESGSTLRQWICRQFEIDSRDSLKLLSVLGRDLPGAVEIAGETSGLPEREPPTEDKPILRFSLTGVQLKLSMVRKGGRFVMPAKDSRGSWIVKFPGSQHPELPEVEAATMGWARASGLETPEFEVFGFDQIQGVDAASFGNPRRVFAIKRFDRTESDGRVHQEDFAQALEFRPEDKYEGRKGAGTSYDLLGRLIKDSCKEDTARDFVRRLAFVVACGNDDAHLKNWSLQWGLEEHLPTLTPCYDLVSTIAWPEYGWNQNSGPSLALSLGREKPFSQINTGVVARFAKRTQIPEAHDVFMHTLGTILAAWPEVAEQAPQRLRDAIRQHWKKVPILRQVGTL